MIVNSRTLARNKLIRYAAMAAVLVPLAVLAACSPPPPPPAPVMAQPAPPPPAPPPPPKVPAARG
jgi:hypothetical protein